MSRAIRDQIKKIDKYVLLHDIFKYIRLYEEPYKLNILDKCVIRSLHEYMNLIDKKKCMKCQEFISIKSYFYINPKTYDEYPKEEINVLCHDCCELHDCFITNKNEKEKMKIREWIINNKYKYDYICFDCCQKNKITFYKCTYCSNEIDYHKELEDLQYGDLVP